VAKRNYAATGLENAKASLNALSRLPSVERCQTFRLPEAATELFLRAENWHFRDYDKTLPLFVPSSFEKNFDDDIDEFDDFYDDTLEYYSPEWIEIGVAEYEERVFFMCIDPESKELGHLRAFIMGVVPNLLKWFVTKVIMKTVKTFYDFWNETQRSFPKRRDKWKGMIVSLWGH